MLDLDGRRVYDKDLQSWIEFENESDAAISELSLVHDIPLPTIDLMLQILRNPNFDPSLLTLKKATDITEHVSLYRRKVASQRISPSGRYVCVGAPFTVLCLLVEEITDSLVGLEKSEDEDIAEDWRDMRLARSLRQDLQNISLVHRSWTPIAQGALRRSVIIRGQVRLNQLLCNPFCGPWVQEVKYQHRSWTDNAVVTWKLMCAFLTRTPELSKLSLSSQAVRSLDEGVVMLDVIRCIQSLSGLKELRLLSSFDYKVPLLPQLCETLPHLRCLELFAISGWACQEGIDDNSELSPALVNSTPPNSLKSLIWEQRNVVVPLPYLEWLLQSRDRYSLEYFKLVFSEGPRAGSSELTKIMLASSNTLLGLLSLKLTIWGNFMQPTPSENYTQLILSQCRSLQHLTLKHIDGEVYSPVLILPKTLVTLRVQTLYTCKDARMAEVIKQNLGNMPYFRRLTVSGFANRLSKTAEVCSDNGIEFVVL